MQPATHMRNAGGIQEIEVNFDFYRDYRENLSAGNRKI